MDTLVFIVVTIAIVISIPFIIDAIRKKDFKDQISGKKKIREVPKSYKENYDQHLTNSTTDQIVQKGIEQIKLDTKSIHL